MERIEPSRAEWDSWTFGAPLQQSWAYGETARALGARAERYVVGRPTDPDAVVQVVRRFGVGYAPVGLHLRHPDVVAGRPPGLTLIAGSGGWVVSDARQVAVRRLDGDLRAGMAKKWRNRLHVAERSDLRIHRIAGCPRWLWDAEAAQRSARRYKALPLAWLRGMTKADTGGVVTYAAFLGALPVAGICVLRHAGRWTYHLGWTDPDGRSRSAHHLLIATAMEDAAKADATLFDLGLVTGQNAGLRRFKLGTGAEAVTVPGMVIGWVSGSLRPRASVPACRAA